MKLPLSGVKISALSAVILTLIVFFNGQDFVRAFIDTLSIVRPA